MFVGSCREKNSRSLDLRFEAPRSFPKGPCTQIVDTLALKYLYKDYIKAKVYAIWVHGPLGFAKRSMASSMV